MARRALSKARTHRLHRLERDSLQNRAAALYQAELDKEAHEKKLGARKICRLVEDEYCKETGKRVGLCYNTIIRLAKGGVSASEFYEGRSWLTPKETDIVIEFINKMAEWGHGLSQRRIKQHVDHLCRARLGDQFPQKGVGKTWTSRFITRHASRLHAYRSKGLDSKRGRAVNPENNKLYWEMNEELILRGDNGKPLKPENIYAFDEVGFLSTATHSNEKIIGAPGKKIQYKETDGSRENFTVVVCICADGTALAPAVIYKGQGFLVKWDQENPANASLGYSRKGWMDRELGVDYAKKFDDETRRKAKGAARAVWVDGHDSHCSYDFLQYLADRNTHVPAYPSHATHVYQSLDVVIFSPLKQAFAEERDKLLRETGAGITKLNFLKVYGEAHKRVLTPELIKTAFRKTGIYPFNPDAISPDALAPSEAFSYKIYTPVAPPTPVRIITDLLVDAIQPPVEPKEGGNQPEVSSHSTGVPRFLTPTRPLRAALPALEASTARYLVSGSPIKGSQEPPDVESEVVSPMKRRGPAGLLSDDLLAEVATTMLEIELQSALKDQINKTEYLKGRVAHLQAGMVLQRLYCKKVRHQLLSKENKAPKRRGVLRSDGKPRLMTAPEFRGAIKEWEDEKEAEETAKKQREVDRDVYKLAMEEWDATDKERRRTNIQRKKDLAAAISDWENERRLAKWEGLKLREWEVENPKPSAKEDEFRQEKAIPRPKMKDLAGIGVAGDGSGEEWETDDEGDDQ